MRTESEQKKISKKQKKLDEYKLKKQKLKDNKSKLNDSIEKEKHQLIFRFDSVLQKNKPIDAEVVIKIPG